jgi:L-2-hydroxyglutarate oxidase LhgO
MGFLTLVILSSKLKVFQKLIFCVAWSRLIPVLQLLAGEKAIKEVEPYCRGIEALWSPHTGIVDWNEVAQHYAKNFEGHGGKIFTGFEASKFENEPSGTRRKLRY